MRTTTRNTDMPDVYAKELRHHCPEVAFTVHVEPDEWEAWDGDGPSPEAQGFSPYVVTVRATAIRDGRFITGEAHLGGCWMEFDEPTGDVHGYLPQMLLEAAEELLRQVETPTGHGTGGLRSAIQWFRWHMRQPATA